MKTFKLLLLLTLLSWCSTAYCAWPWRNFLSIQHIGVGHGDCTLIIASDSNAEKMTIVLIDAGDKGKGKNIVWPYLKNNIGAFVGQPGVSFLIMCSHLHSDHMGGMVEVLDSIRQNWGTGVVTYVVDRTINPVPYYTPLAVKSCYDRGVDNPASGVFTLYNAAANYFNRSNIGVAKDIFRLCGLNNFSMACVAANGWVPGTNVVNENVLNENDLSYGFIIRFGAFKYFTGGDLGGGGNYTDMETPLSNSAFVDSILRLTVTPHVCAFKVTHHGSSHSTNAVFLNKFNPSLAIFEAGLRSFRRKVLPTKQCYDSLLIKCSKLDYTYRLEPFKHYPGASKNDITLYCDVIINVYNPVASADGTLTVQYQTNFKESTSPFTPYPPSSNTTFTCNRQH